EHLGPVNSGTGSEGQSRVPELTNGAFLRWRPAAGGERRLQLRNTGWPVGRKRRVETSAMMNSRFGWTRTIATVALVGGVVVSSLLTGGAVDAKHKKHHHGKTSQPPVVSTPQPPAITTDVSIVSIEVGPDSGDHRSVLVEVRNDGDVAVSPFVIELSAD